LHTKGAALEAERLVVEGIQLEVFRGGEGRPVLMLHEEEGFDPTAEFLDPLTAHAEVIAPSHPGFGHSSGPGELDSVDDLSYFYLDLLDRLGLTDVILMGFSLGGWISAEMAVRCTHRISKLVLVAPVGIKVGDRETRDIADIYALPPERLAALKYHEPDRAKRDLASLSDDELTVIARNRESTARLAWEPYMHNPRLRRRLRRIGVPTLLLWGASDGIVTPAYGEAYRESIPGSRLEIIPEAGHLPHVEQPAAFAEHVLQFLT
jgi:pimeloyl-ACP methyl ester carboxylesterase